MVENTELNPVAPKVNARVSIRQIFPGLIAFNLILLFAGCASVGIQNEDTLGAPAPEKAPSHVYVRDFRFAIEDYHPREDALDDQSFLQSVQETLTTQTVLQLRQDGFPATGLGHTVPLPGEGWLITGRFTRLFEGDRVLRAAIGLGAGETQIQAEVYFYDLAAVEDGKLRPFYRFRLNGGSGNMPGVLPSLGITTYTPITLTLIELPEGLSYASQGLRLLPDVQKDLKRGARMINGAFQDYLVSQKFLDPDHQQTHPKRVGQLSAGILPEE